MQLFYDKQDNKNSSGQVANASESESKIGELEKSLRYRLCCAHFHAFAVDSRFKT